MGAVETVRGPDHIAIRLGTLMPGVCPVVPVVRDSRPDNLLP